MHPERIQPAAASLLPRSNQSREAGKSSIVRHYTWSRSLCPKLVAHLLDLRCLRLRRFSSAKTSWLAELSLVTSRYSFPITNKMMRMRMTRPPPP
jgi:hypothetical protein